MREYEAIYHPFDGPESQEREARSERAAHSITEPDPETADKSLQWTPELTLMLAVLEDAIACYRMTLKRPRQNPEILARQAEFWIRLDDWESPFSFNNICDALGLDSTATRERILSSMPS
jgi:hypothetical protein